MNCKFTNVLMFAAGAAIGSAVTWKILQTKYEQIVQEEIASVKEALADMATDDSQSVDDDTEDEEEDRYYKSERPHQINWDELEDLDEEEEYEEYAELAGMYSNEEGGTEKVAKEPYVISPYDFDEIGYRTIELTYYADGILEDEDHEIVTDVDDLIGVGSLNTFGEYEEDSVFVRNEQLRIDIQILRDYRTYAQATGASPVQVDNE